MVLFDLWNSLSCRSENRSVFEVGILSNSMYNLAIAFVLIGQYLVLHFSVFQTVFSAVALTWKDWGFLMILSSSVMWAEEFRKRFTLREKYSSIK